MLAPFVFALATSAVDPCALLDADDVARVLGWSVQASSPERTYRLPGGSGRMCIFDGRAGTVTVTIPSKGSGIPTNDLTSDTGTLRTPMHSAYGLGVPAELGPGSAIIHARGADYGITVAPLDAQFADEQQMRALATVLISRLPRRGHHA